jgi:hypothetical protein
MASSLSEPRGTVKGTPGNASADEELGRAEPGVLISSLPFQSNRRAQNDDCFGVDLDVMTSRGRFGPANQARDA